MTTNGIELRRVVCTIELDNSLVRIETISYSELR